MRGLVMVSLVVTALLAGCSASGDPQELAPSPSASPSPTPTNATQAASSPPLRLDLTADVVNGSAPLRVNFTLSSLDGPANVTWTLVAALLPDGAEGNATGANANATASAGTPELSNGTELANGTSLPSVVNHTFLEGGSWAVLLSVGDGQGNGSAMVRIEVTGDNRTAERVPVVLAEYAATGLIGGPYLLTNDPLMAHQCPGFNLGEDGLGCVFLEFSAVGAHDALPATMTTDAANFRLAFWDECAPTGHGIGFASGVSGDRLEIPAGAGCGVAWSSNTGDWGEDRTFTLTVYDWLPDSDE